MSRLAIAGDRLIVKPAVYLLKAGKERRFTRSRSFEKIKVESEKK